MSNQHPSLFAILLSGSLPSLYRIIYRLLVSSSTPPTTHHRPPQNIFTLWRIWYRGSQITIPRHFLRIPLFSCLLLVAENVGCCYFYFVEACSEMIPALVSSLNLSYNSYFEEWSKKYRTSIKWLRGKMWRFMKIQFSNANEEDPVGSKHIHFQLACNN